MGLPRTHDRLNELAAAHDVEFAEGMTVDEKLQTLRGAGIDGSSGARATAIVLPVDRAQSVEPQVFGNFPGVWSPGVPVHPQALGLTLYEARELIEARNLPFEFVTVDTEEAQHEPVQRALLPSPERHLRPTPAQGEAIVTSTGAVVQPVVDEQLADVQPWAEQLAEQNTERLRGSDAEPEAEVIIGEPDAGDGEEPEA